MVKNLVSNGCTIAYDYLPKIGSETTVVLIHGYGVDRSMWQPQVGALQEKYTVINADVRGHGKSRPCASFTIRQAAEDIKKLLAAHNCGCSILIGLSMGGYIVQEFALAYGGAAGYMVCGATPLFLPCYSRFEKFALRHSGGLFWLYPWNTLKRLMTNASAVTGEARKRVLLMFDSMNKKEFIASWQGIAQSPHEADMKFDAPLLVVCGDKDNTGTIRKCMKYWEPAYGCKTAVISSAAHIVNLDAPDAFNRLMLDFIESCTGRGAHAF